MREPGPPLRAEQCLSSDHNTIQRAGNIPRPGRHNTRLRTKVKLLPHLHLIMFILRDVFIQLHNQFVLVGKRDKQTLRSPRECFMRRFQSSVICEEEYLCIQTIQANKKKP